MTQEEWLKCDYPFTMMVALERRASDRKLRLLGYHCCRHPTIWRLLSSQPAYRSALRLIEASGRYAEGEISREELLIAAQAVPRAPVMGGYWKPARLPLVSQALRAASSLAGENAWEATWGVVKEGANLLGSFPCDLMRELFRNPSSPAGIDYSWLSWDGSVVLELARVICDRPSFDLMPILGDALEEAGCIDDDILAHCREPVEHMRGCWVVDALLEKG